jgi:hypothetical protein
MKRLSFVQFIFVLLLGLSANAQTSLILPDQSNWNVVEEGKTISFQLRLKGNLPDSTHLQFSIPEGRVDGMKLDSLGNFAWTPSFDLVDRIQGSKIFPVLFEASVRGGEQIRKVAEFRVLHVNRAPYVGELKPFYVQYNVQNTYQVDGNSVRDPDGDPLVFIPIPDEMPEGAKLSAQGEFTWKPSQTQFNRLKASPLWVEFYVEDQPMKSRSKGRLKIDVTQLDLPPEISVVPNTRSFKIRENSTLSLAFFLTDPNGDQDIQEFSFLSDNPSIPKSSLKRNTDNQYEFIWKPDYEFVKDPLDTLGFNITFFVIDKSQKKDEKKIHITVENAVNEREKDFQLYTQYRTALIRAWELISQLTEKQEELRRLYSRAKSGKKNRSVMNAGIGAATAITPLTMGTNPNKTLVSTIGGTATATVGTLEATEVIGRSISPLVDQLNKIIVKKNELQTKGDIFARKYNLRSSRRGSGSPTQFARDLDDFESSMKVNDLLALELDASWQDRNMPRNAQEQDKRLQKMFRDYVPFTD